VLKPNFSELSTKLISAQSYENYVEVHLTGEDNEVNSAQITS